MTLHVLIHRGTKETPYCGTLRAWVVQGGRRGENLLKGHQYTSVETAKTMIHRQLPGCEIEWEICA